MLWRCIALSRCCPFSQFSSASLSDSCTLPRFSMGILQVKLRTQSPEYLCRRRVPSHARVLRHRVRGLAFLRWPAARLRVGLPACWGPFRGPGGGPTRVRPDSSMAVGFPGPSAEATLALAAVWPPEAPFRTPRLSGTVLPRPLPRSVARCTGTVVSEPPLPCRACGRCHSAFSLFVSKLRSFCRSSLQSQAYPGFLGFL